MPLVANSHKMGRSLAMNLKDDMRTLGALIRRNPATGEIGLQILLRRIHSVEMHMRNFEDRYADLENRFNEHAQGRKHAPNRKEVPPDEG